MRLADHDDYRITLHRAGDAPTEKLLVTFGGQPSGISDTGFGTDFAALNGWDNIFVAQRHGSQFQGLSLEKFVDSVAPITVGRDVISYGASLGGYAALYFGGAINARIIAAAPMQSLWPEVRTKTMGDMALQHRYLHEVPASRHLPVVIYDPQMKRDRTVAETIIPRAYPTQRTVQVPYAGHTVLVALSKARLLKPLITGIVEDDRIIPLDMPTDTSPIWHIQRGKHLRRSDPEAARRHLEASLQIEPSLHASSLLLVTLIRSGDLDAAQALIDQAAASSDKRLRFNRSAVAQAQSAGLHTAA